MDRHGPEVKRCGRRPSAAPLVSGSLGNELHVRAGAAGQLELRENVRIVVAELLACVVANVEQFLEIAARPVQDRLPVDLILIEFNSLHIKSIFFFVLDFSLCSFSKIFKSSLAIATSGTMMDCTQAS
jgi:hypothetical protein